MSGTDEESLIINLAELEREFFSPSENPVHIKFGTSGHRGKLGAGFSQFHAQAIAQAVARFHLEENIKGPVLVGGDTRLMSDETSLICAEVLAANGIPVILADNPLPTPVFSSEIMAGTACAGLNGTASHNPPQDMGLKYNASNGGPADTDITLRIQDYANHYLSNSSLVKRVNLGRAENEGFIIRKDLVSPYLERLAQIIDFKAIKSSGLRITLHPLGGSALRYFEAIAEKFNLTNVSMADKTIDPSFSFIPPDYDGKIRMDPSSKYPMAPLLKLTRSGLCDFAAACDPDADRFGCATKKGGLIAPNHALCVAFYSLLNNKPGIPENLMAGRSIGTTHLIDKIAADHNVKVDEVDVGFKRFADGLFKNRYLIAGEESAGMSIYKWTTEKDGIMAVFLLAEIMAKSGQDIADIYEEITSRYGAPIYRRIDAPVDEKTKSFFKSLTAREMEAMQSMAGGRVIKIRATDGIKIYLEDGWALARLSGTEPIIKLYAESFSGPEHLEQIIAEASRVFGIALEVTTS
ncbi:MAG: phosphoglucomutase, alpha-D-glucose phosphate-specific [Elusimicrobia bacterium]|nr:phosphoglucomutase, alpha-D-glucose phosphate-specific [Elusimicrobiota bacterium]